nr:hypothetical protein [Tanacetum cinerariifolium]
MATTIEQQVALDEALVPSIQRLRIGEANFDYHRTFNPRNPLCNSSTMFCADVPSSRHSLLLQMYLKFTCRNSGLQLMFINIPSYSKLDNKKHIVNLETFRDMFHICSRILGQSFDELPFEEEILEFLREAAPKPKASEKRKRSGSDTSITPPTAITTPTTTIAITPRLTAAANGKQPAKAKSPSDPSELARAEAQ